MEPLKYSIQEIGEVTTIGQEVELTDNSRSNLSISMQFWKNFNVNLKKAYLSQYGNWVKYAFMYRKEHKLYYYCSIPKKNIVPENFIEKEIEPHKYLVVEHIGSMDRIYSTYNRIYHELIAENDYCLEQTEFLHFEKYDYRFHWNREGSVIEIWVPIK